ncbi:hypothetical protein ACFLXU_04900 [Chloroflexota bacterium]
MNPKGRARIYCSGRAEGLGYNNRGTFLDIYESQVEWYLEQFVIPEDYQQIILEAHNKLQSAYDGDQTRVSLERRLTHLKNLYEWGDIDESEYRAKRDAIERELRALTPVQAIDENLDRFAHFLANVADAWKEATQEQRNELAHISGKIERQPLLSACT